MNLNNMFRDASLNNLQWLNNPETYAPQNKDNDKKDDLELQWETGNFDPTFEPSPEAIKNNPQTNDTAEIVQKTREWLNQGMTKDEVVVLLLSSYPKEAISQAKTACAKVFHLSGILGRVAVDVTGYKNPKDALKHASLSPYKKHIKYVVGYSGDNVSRMTISPKSVVGSVVEGSAGNATDAFFANDTKVATETRAFCNELMMPILAHSFDLDPSEMDKTLIELNAGGYLSSAEIKAVTAKFKTPYSQIKHAFLLIDAKKKAKLASKYEGKVAVEQFKIAKSDTPIEFNKVSKLAKVDVDDMAKPKQGNIALPASMPDEKVSIEKDAGLDVSIAKAEKDEEMNLKEGSLDITIAGENEKDLDVDASGFVAKTFKGGDEFDLDAEKEVEGSLDIDARGDFSFE